MWFLDKVNSTLLSEQTKVDGFLSPRTGNSELQMPSLLSVETLTLSDSRLPPDFPTAAPDLELENPYFLTGFAFRALSDNAFNGNGEDDKGKRVRAIEGEQWIELLDSGGGGDAAQFKENG
nr:uncharacterized protein LOC109187862 [Ipomoea batatas]